MIKYHNHPFLCVIMAIASMLSLGSCIPKDNEGFPDKINYSSDGGTEIIKGNETPLYVHIYEGKDFVDPKGTYSFDQDSLICEWLTFRRGSSVHEFELTAAPNESYKKQSLTLELFFGKTWGMIRINQKGR